MNKPLLLIGTIIAIILIAITVLVIQIEQKHRNEKLANKTLFSSSRGVSAPTPTPPPSYTQASINHFLSAVQMEDVTTKKVLSRWEQEEVRISLRGQSATDDAICVDAAISDLNSVMKTTHLTRSSSPTSSVFEIYVLPQPQFTSVYVDTPADRRAFIVYNVGYKQEALHDVKMLIDATLTPQDRCSAIRANMLQAIGLFSPTDQTIPYASSDLEAVRILYSPYLTSGLTRTEVLRRVQP